MLCSMKLVSYKVPLLKSNLKLIRSSRLCCSSLPIEHSADRCTCISTGKYFLSYFANFTHFFCSNVNH